ncbi:hypothetical protein OIU84_004214 [Salix udensis]|uniref:Protein FAR1-RELATED SEQUENCE n=1 Tax=Salix udensis TaxID=889485 RepID=A0AAD6K1S7_9ROSI|nr:hypothetical protein OIU84_004214 [Salix udensis]
MGIDLEQPSREYHKEDRRPNENVNMVDGGGEGHERDQNIVNSPDISGNGCEKTRTVINERVLHGRKKPNAGDGINLNSVKDAEPHDGMEFESKDEAFSFYKEYAKSVGFSTITKASRRSRISGKFIDAKFVCTRYGTKRDTSTIELPQPVSNADAATSLPVKRKRGRINQSWSKTDCKACMHVKRRQQDGRWVVRSFIREHNHEIFPDQAYYYRGHRNLDLGNDNVDAMQAIRARTKKLYVAMSRQSGGHKKHENQKGGVTNPSGNTKHLALDEGDAQAMLDHFMYMQDANPNFFYAIDLNEEQQLRNVFWVDAKGRLDYGSFGDVIFFDTTYLKNEYKLPFVPFIGVNHHFQFLLLGCALVADETKTTYVWLMRAWLRAMGGHAPRVILTDQDNALKEAIQEVFPNSRHCFCLWHVFSKIPEKLSYVTRQHENFLLKFKKCILKSWSSEQFEKRWWKMVEIFNLRNDVWFQSLYEDRQRWIPVFMIDNCLAGMSTTQRSESINTLFDRYMQRKTTLKEFLEQQKTMLQEKFEEEAKADFETWHKQPGLKSPSPFGKQMASIYTHAIFKKFQVEVLGVVACHPRKETEGETQTFKVQDFEDNQYFMVVWNEKTSYLCCSCRLFEFNGFLCRHVLIVMQMSEFNATTIYVNGPFKLGDEGSLSQESYNIAFNALEEALRKCESVNNSIQNIIEPTLPPSNGPLDYEEVNQAHGASKTNKKKDTARKKQVHPEPEVIPIRMHDSWQQMEQINSRVSTLDGYFGSQQTGQGMGQLNAIAPNDDAHYMMQQRMQGMGQIQFRPQTIPSFFDVQDGLQEMDPSNLGSSQLHGLATKHLHQKHLSR